ICCLCSGGWGGRAAGPRGRDLEARGRFGFETLRAPPAAAVCPFAALVDVPTFHPDPERQSPVIRAVKQAFSPAPPYPNWTAVGVNWLAGFDFEIKVIARIPDGPRA
ncbi:Rid family hydrolase, partial [Cronobacter malonaticus]|uniref:Rid family hydrolase n=1 Tax=Cronobacter malonaticus TaxID=413503 RepID=UPI0024AFC12F